MGANIEIKARARDWPGLHERAAVLSGGPPQLIEQDDTFYHVPRGRLKLRVFSSDRGELIYYERDDGAVPRPSSYEIAPTGDPAALDAVLRAALGVRGRVRKKRWLYLAGQTRIHLDEVENLGRFLELEYVLRPGEPHEAGLETARKLFSELGVAPEDAVETAYVDLLMPGAERNAPSRV